MPEVQIPVGESERVTAVMYGAERSKRSGVTILLGHGAGSDQKSWFMVHFARELAARGLDAVTFNFLYTEQGRRTPDRTDRLEACYRAAIDSVRERPDLAENRLVIGGKSMGGRIASQVAAKGVENLAGLVFLGYPLHPPGKPDHLRSAHLQQITAPMLFVQGSRDAFGTPDELAPIIEKLGATFYIVEAGDHSLKVPKKWPVPQAQVYAEAIDKIAEWIRKL